MPAAQVDKNVCNTRLTRLPRAPGRHLSPVGQEKYFHGNARKNSAIEGASDLRRVNGFVSIHPVFKKKRDRPEGRPRTGGNGSMRSGGADVRQEGFDLGAHGLGLDRELAGGIQNLG